jgi:hypothetical protein
MTPPPEPRTAVEHLLDFMRPMIQENAADTVAYEEAVRQSILAIEAEASRIDAERLARALHVVFEEKWPKVGVLPDVPVTVFGGYAEDIAKAYEAEDE